MSVLSITYYSFVSNVVLHSGQMHHHLFIHFSTDKNIGLNLLFALLLVHLCC